jgi:hypothetical protein
MPTGGRPRSIMSGTSYQKNHSHPSELCDFLVFYSIDRERVYAIEMKSGRVDVGKVVSQIQAGASLLEKLTKDQPDVVFSPILVHGGGISAPERKILARRKIRFRNQDYELFRLKCGAALLDVR